MRYLLVDETVAETQKVFGYEASTGLCNIVYAGKYCLPVAGFNQGRLEHPMRTKPVR